MLRDILLSPPERLDPTVRVQVKSHDIHARHLRECHGIDAGVADIETGRPPGIVAEKALVPHGYQMVRVDALDIGRDIADPVHDRLACTGARRRQTRSEERRVEKEGRSTWA